MKWTMKNHNLVWIVVFALALCVPTAFAQQKDPRLNPPAKPVPPIGADESSSAATTAPAANSAPATQDSKPLNGAEEWHPGDSGGGRNLLLSSLNVHFGGDANSQSGNGGFSSVTTVGGMLTLQRLWRTDQLQLTFAGSGSFYSTASDRNRTHQDLRFSYSKAWRTWNFMIADSVKYSPEGGTGRGFGLGSFGPGFGGLGGNQLIGLNPLYGPNQSILSHNSPRIGNTLIGQAQYSINARSSVSFTGSYGVLRFLDSGFIGSDSYMAQASYNRALSARDTIAVSYGFRTFRFSGNDDRNASSSVFVSYGRKLGSRLTWHVSGGPQFIQSLRGTATTTPTDTERISWSARTSLQYRMERAALGFSYFHAVTEGSGYFQGANTDNFTFTYGVQLSRTWRTSFHASYARNQALYDFLDRIGGRRVNGWGGGLSLSRPLGRTTRINFDYTARYQSTENLTCTGPTCAYTGMRHTFGIGFSFSPNAIELE